MPTVAAQIVPQPSDPHRMAALIGPARARLILMGGQKISAGEALAFGLVERLVAPGDLMAHAQSLVADTVAAPLETAQAIKKMCL